MSRGKKAYDKGLQLEKDFAKWMRKKLGYNRIMFRQFVNGKVATRKYEIDIYAMKESFIWRFLEIIGIVLVVMAIFMLMGELNTIEYYLSNLLRRANIRLTGGMLLFVGLVGLLVGYLGSKRKSKKAWVECKNLKGRVKRDHIFKLKSVVRDVRKARKSRAWHPNIVMMVSGNGFDIDALKMAKAHNITCYQRDGKGFKQVLDK
jgi:hypothetical protein